MPEALVQEEATAELELVGVSRYHGDAGTRVVALRSVSLALGRGELVAVVGESGSGKTTLLAVAGGLDYASEGRVIIGGRDLSALTADEVALLRRRRVGYVFQDFNLVPGLTAGENVSLPLELVGHALGRGVSSNAAGSCAKPEFGFVATAGLCTATPHTPCRPRSSSVGSATAGGRWRAADRRSGALASLGLSPTDLHIGELVIGSRIKADPAGAAVVRANGSSPALLDRLPQVR